MTRINLTSTKQTHNTNRREVCPQLSGYHVFKTHMLMNAHQKDKELINLVSFHWFLHYLLVFWDPFYLLGLTLITYPLHRLEVWKWKIISSETFLSMWLRIHAGSRVNPYWYPPPPPPPPPPPSTHTHPAISVGMIWALELLARKTYVFGLLQCNWCRWQGIDNLLTGVYP